MFPVADGALGVHVAEIAIIAIPILIIACAIAFIRGIRRGMHRD